MAKSKYNFIGELIESLTEVAEVGRNGKVKMKRGDVKAAIEKAFQDGVIAAAGGERVRFPVVGALVRKEVKARKGGEKTTNPFTGEPMVTKARPATKKPRWSFPKSLKETFANKRYW